MATSERDDFRCAKTRLSETPRATTVVNSQCDQRATSDAAGDGTLPPPLLTSTDTFAAVFF